MVQERTPKNLTQLNDVVVTSIADNDLIAYDTSSSKYINQSASEAGIQTSLTFSTGTTNTDGTITTNDSEIDHNSLSNTHNLTTDITHNSISGLNDGATYQHITTTQETNFETAYSASHARKHNIDSTDDHTGVTSATENNFISFDASGLPKDSGKDDADYLHLDQTTPQTISNGQPIFDTLTASEIVATDSDKKLSSLAVATYPSLTELSYVKGLTSSAQPQITGKNPLHGVIARPIGATNPLPTNLTTTTFTLGAAANNISYYYNGILVNVTTNKTTTLSEGAGFYWIYFDAATGDILATKAEPGLGASSNVLIATVNWNGSDYGLVQDERHADNRNKPWHVWAHNTIGVRYRSGLTLTHNGGTGNAATFATTAGEIADEDIQFSISASSAFPTANGGRLLWQSGASTYSFNKVLSTVPGYLGANQRPNYVKSSDYSVVEMSSAPNRYINVFVYSVTDLTVPIYFVTESISDTLATANGYTSLANARSATFPNLSTFGLSPEMKPIYRLIWRADGVLQAIDTVQDDYRTVSSLPMAAGTTATTASAVSYNPYGTISTTNVQNALNELSDEKAPIDSPTFATSITGSYLTASEILITDADKKIVSAPVVTYPSLTELSYVKGLSSAVQDQIGGKAATDQTFYIGTTQVAINRGSAALTLAGITLTTPNIGTPSGGTLTNCTFPTLNQNTTGSSGSCTGNSATVTGFTPASGSLTLAGADELTLTTTAETSVTLPTAGTLMANLSEDTTPTLGGDLDVDAKKVLLGATGNLEVYDHAGTTLLFKVDTSGNVYIKGRIITL